VPNTSPTEAEREKGQRIRAHIASRGYDPTFAERTITAALAAAREQAQAEADARVIDMREACAKLCRTGFARSDAHMGRVLENVADAIAALPLPGAERWVKLMKLPSNLNELQVASMRRLREALKWSHHTDIIVRKDGQDLHFEADYLREMLDAVALAPFGEREGK